LNLHKSSEDIFVGEYKNIYIGHSNDNTIYENAQSGGLVTTILKCLFDNAKIDAALVCRMSYGETPVVSPVIITEPNQLYATQKSCYTPVDILSALKNTHNYRSIALVGLPCHIQGLRHLQANGKKFQNVRYAIGLICDRTLCATIQDSIKDYCNASKYKFTWNVRNLLVKKKYFFIWRGKKIERGDIRFPYRTAPLAIIDNFGKEIVFPNKIRFLLKDMFTSPRCKVCYDKLNIHADIVLGDPWGMSGVDWNLGDNVVIVRNETGQNIINQLLKQNLCTLHVISDIAELRNGQKMDERRSQVCVYSMATDVLPRTVDLFLHHFDKIITSVGQVDSEVQKARNEYRIFANRERLPKKKIVEEALNVLTFHLNAQKQSNQIKNYLKAISFRIRNHVHQFCR